jgi:hypothetical protein
MKYIIYYTETRNLLKQKSFRKKLIQQVKFQSILEGGHSIEHLPKVSRKRISSNINLLSSNELTDLIYSIYQSNN